MKNAFPLAILSAALTLTVACGTPSPQCKTNADCIVAGQVCTSGKCVADTSTLGGGGGTTGGGTGGGTTGGGTGTGGGSTGGGTGGGSVGPNGCSNAVELTSGMLVTDTTADAGNGFAFVDGAGCQGAATLDDAVAGDKVYRVRVAAGSRLHATLDTGSTDSVFNLVVGAASCGMDEPDAGTVGLACAAGRDDPDDGSLDYVNTTTAAQDVFLLVDGYGLGDEGTFTVGATVTPLVAGDLCDNAVTLTAPRRWRPRPWSASAATTSQALAARLVRRGLIVRTSSRCRTASG